MVGKLGFKTLEMLKKKMDCSLYIEVAHSFTNRIGAFRFIGIYQNTICYDVTFKLQRWYIHVHQLQLQDGLTTFTTNSTSMSYLHQLETKDSFIFDSQIFMICKCFKKILVLNNYRKVHVWKSKISTRFKSSKTD